MQSHLHGLLLRCNSPGREAAARRSSEALPRRRPPLPGPPLWPSRRWRLRSSPSLLHPPVPYRHRQCWRQTIRRRGLRRFPSFLELRWRREAGAFLDSFADFLEFFLLKEIDALELRFLFRFKAIVVARKMEERCFAGTPYIPVYVMLPVSRSVCSRFLVVLAQKILIVAFDPVGRCVLSNTCRLLEMSA